MNLASGLGRYRVNIFKQRNQTSPKAPICYKDLGLPPVLMDLIMQKRGLILFVRDPNRPQR